MSTQPSEADVELIRDLIGRSEMRGVEYHELSAKWTGSRDDSDPDQDVDIQLEIQHRCGDADFGFRVVGTVTAAMGEATAAVAITYDYEGDPPLQRTLFGFGNEVAVMALFPYFRESIHSITAKVFGQPIMLPVLPRGVVGLDLDEAKDTAANAN